MPSSDNVVPLHRGPGSPHTRGAVVDVYADTQALEIACPECGQPVGKFCVWKSGDERKTPCGPRLGRKAAKR